MVAGIGEGVQVVRLRTEYTLYAVGFVLAYALLSVILAIAILWIG